MLLALSHYKKAQVATKQQRSVTAEVVAAITKDSAEGLDLTEGDEVLAVIKSTEVMVAKEL